MIARIGDVDVAGAWMRDDAMRFAEQGLQRRAGDAFAAFGSVAGEGDELALGDDELADAMIARVGNEEVVIAVRPEVLDACERRNRGGVFEGLHFAIGASHAQTVSCGDEDVALGVHSMGATAADARERADEAGAHVHDADAAFAIATDGELGAVMVEGEAGDPAKPGSHGRAAIAGDFLVTIASDCRDDAGLGINAAHAVVKGVGDVEIARGIGDEVMRCVEAGLSDGARIAYGGAGFRR